MVVIVELIGATKKPLFGAFRTAPVALSTMELGA